MEFRCERSSIFRSDGYLYSKILNAFSLILTFSLNLDIFFSVSDFLPLFETLLNSLKFISRWPTIHCVEFEQSY